MMTRAQERRLLRHYATVKKTPLSPWKNGALSTKLLRPVMGKKGKVIGHVLTTKGRIVCGLFNT